MYKHLEYISHALSYCSEQKHEAEKKKDATSSKYWRDIHQILVHACRDIQLRSYERIKEE